MCRLESPLKKTKTILMLKLKITEAVIENRRRLQIIKIAEIKSYSRKNHWESSKMVFAPMVLEDDLPRLY